MSGAKKKSERRAAQAQAGLSEREKQELLKKQAQRRNNILAIVGGVIAVVLVVALLVWNSGVIARHTTAVKFTSTEAGASDLTLTRADMDYFYHLALNNRYAQEQQLADMYEKSGLEYTYSFDPNASLKTQYVDQAQTMSYHDYFMQQAMSDATEIIALSNAAKAAGHTLSADAQASLDNAGTDLDAQVQQYGMGSRNNYLRAVYGRTMNEAVYYKNLERNIWASDYYTATTEPMGDYSDEELDAYYAEHTDELDGYNYDYAYFDGTAQPTTDAEGNSVEPTEEEKTAALAQAKKNAEDMLAAVKANAAAPAQGEGDAEGEAQTKDFATLAQDYGTTASTQTNNAGSNFSREPFADWLKDAARANGDADMFEVEGSGWYVVQFLGRQRSDGPSVADVRHILIATSHEDDPATADVDESQTPFTDEEVTAAHTEAERILQEFTSGEQTGERFGQLAEQYSQDSRNEDGSLVTAGGLYEDVKPDSSYVQEFLDWIFTADRKAGDTGIVRTDYGYHIMYLDSMEEAKWKADSRAAMLTEERQAFVDEAKAKYQVVVDKWSKAVAQESAQPSQDDSQESAQPQG